MNYFAIFKTTFLAFCFEKCVCDFMAAKYEL